MFSSLKIGLVLFILASAGGGYWYVQKLQKDNQILKANAIKLESAVADQKQVIESQAADFKKIRSTLNKLEEENAKLQKDKQDLSKRLGKHDIGNLAENKPGLVERIINGASKSAARCVEIASGSPLTEEELNGTPNRECPSFWPTP
jgi:regulator of replication initiation timing|tara:strand:- start:6108 stop:6548 length:441 start_codon:yes stop_codon:yes gene_type:complete